MQLKTTIFWCVFSFLLFAGVQVAASDQKEFLDEYHHVSFDDIKKPKKVDLNLAQETLVGKFVLEQYGKFFDHKILGVYAVDNRFIYVKLYLMLKEEHGTEWLQLQRARVINGESRQSTLIYDFAVIDMEEHEVFPLGINYRPEDGVIRFHFGGCLNDKFAFESDINGDGEKELFFIRGYEAGTDAYTSVFSHYKLYLLADYNTLLFDEWLLNIDHSYREPNSRKKPNITGMAGSQITPEHYEIKYDGYDDFVRTDRSGLRRLNSQFYFNYIDKDGRGISKQLVLVWSKIYRPSPDPKERDFVMTEERFKWYEGDVSNKEAFVEKPVTEEYFKAFLANYSLSFDDGLTEKRLCDVK